MCQGNDLVAEVFYNASDNPMVDAIQFNSYRLRSAAQTLGLHMAPSRTHATVVALSNTTSSGRQQQEQQTWRPLPPEVSVTPTEGAVTRTVAGLIGHGFSLWMCGGCCIPFVLATLPLQC